MAVSLSAEPLMAEDQDAYEVYEEEKEARDEDEEHWSVVAAPAPSSSYTTSSPCSRSAAHRLPGAGSSSPSSPFVSTSWCGATTMPEHLTPCLPAYMSHTTPPRRVFPRADSACLPALSALVHVPQWAADGGE